MTYSAALTLRVAEMYYYQKLSQKAIAEQLSLSVPTVSRVLAQALETGQVHVQIVDNSGRLEDLERRICSKFGLKAARVIALPKSIEQRDLRKLLGKTAADLLYQLVRPDNKIGIGPGETMFELVQSLNPGHVLPGLRLAPLMGGWEFGGVAYEGNKLVGTAASVLHCDYSIMACPAFVSGREVRDILLKEPAVAQISDMWKSLDLAVFGVGSDLEHGSCQHLLGSSASSVSEKKAAVGNILGRLIDAEGRELDVDFNRRILSIPLSQLSRVPLRMGVGGGCIRIRCIWAALKAKLINVIITDESTCSAILKLEER